MSFKWGKEKEESSIPSPPDNKYEETNEISCNTFSTCPKYNEEELKEFQRIKACWDNVGDIKYDKETGCFYKLEDKIKIYFNYGICPKCDELYFSRIGIVCNYIELNEICKECENGPK